MDIVILIGSLAVAALALVGWIEFEYGAPDEGSPRIRF